MVFPTSPAASGGVGSSDNRKGPRRRVEDSALEDSGRALARENGGECECENIGLRDRKPERVGLRKGQNGNGDDGAGGCHSVLGEETWGWGAGEALRRSKAVKCGWWPSEDAFVEGARLSPWRLPGEPGRHAGVRAGQGRGQGHLPTLTQSEASVELQVGGEEAGQAGENLAAGLPAVDLVAAVDQAVGGAPVMRLVQHPAEQLPFPDDHLQTDGHQRWVGGNASCVRPPTPPHLVSC